MGGRAGASRPPRQTYMGQRRGYGAATPNSRSDKSDREIKTCASFSRVCSGFRCSPSRFMRVRRRRAAAPARSTGRRSRCRISGPRWTIRPESSRSRKGRRRRASDESSAAPTDARSLPSTRARTRPATPRPATCRNNLKLPRSALSYERVTRSFFAISTVREGSIYYSRCNFSAEAGGAIHCIDLVYPQEQRRAWDDVVTRISRSLRPLEG